MLALIAALTLRVSHHQTRSFADAAARRHLGQDRWPLGSAEDQSPFSLRVKPPKDTMLFPQAVRGCCKPCGEDSLQGVARADIIPERPKFAGLDQAKSQTPHSWGTSIPDFESGTPGTALDKDMFRQGMCNHCHSSAAAFEIAWQTIKRSTRYAFSSWAV